MKAFLCISFLAAVVLAEPPAYNQQQPGGQRYFFARQQEAAPYPSSGWKPEGQAFNLPQRQQKQVAGSYVPPQAPHQQYGPPAPQQQYGPPAPQQQYGPPTPPQQQYGAPARLQQQPQQQRPSRLPARQQQFNPSQASYNPPQQQYGAPQQQYGAPEFTTVQPTAFTEVDEPTTVPGFSETEQVGSAEFNEEEADIDEPSSRRPKPQKQEKGEYYVALPDGRLQRVRYVSRQDLEAMRYIAKIHAENVEPLRGPIYAYAPLQRLEVAPGNLQVAPGSLQVAVGPATQVQTPVPESRPQRLQAASDTPKVEIKPIAQVQIQHDNPAPAAVVPLSSTSYTTFTANYQIPTAIVPVEDRFVLAFP